MSGLRKLENDPFHHLTHYEGKYYKLRIGDYRALIDVEFSTRTLWVRKIGHRKEIYK
jgi:mRNA-degrading endonuclease RelE of RelBE toxin-antitoxin system